MGSYVGCVKFVRGCLQCLGVMMFCYDVFDAVKDYKTESGCCDTGRAETGPCDFQ